jgi:hypothetical protein
MVVAKNHLLFLLSLPGREEEGEVSGGKLATIESLE